MNFLKEMKDVIKVVYDYDTDSDYVFLESCGSYDRDFDNLTIVYDPQNEDVIRNFIKKNIKQSEHCLEIFEKKPDKIFGMLLKKSTKYNSFTEAMVADAGSLQGFYDKYVKTQEEAAEIPDVEEEIYDTSEELDNDFFEEDDTDELEKVSESEDTYNDDVEIETEDESMEEEEEFEEESIEEEREVEEKALFTDSEEFEETAEDNSAVNSEDFAEDDNSTLGALDIADTVNEIHAHSPEVDKEDADCEDCCEDNSTILESVKTDEIQKKDDNKVEGLDDISAERFDTLEYVVTAIAEHLDVNISPNILSQDEIAGLLRNIRGVDSAELLDTIFKVLSSMSSKRERAFVTEILGKIILALQYKGLLKV